MATYEWISTPNGGEGPSCKPPSQVHKTLKWGAMERSKKLYFPMWDTPPKPMQLMPLVMCVCEREREREGSPTLHLLERKERKFALDHKNLLESKPFGKGYRPS
jgi:hypothetical protein